ncbi:hypothetical protein [Vulgatibacter sp.]|uniref:hypothetical protein n=1 Tax=Vulgatibacter sp. TaxID=1971226 RepID=UPI0035657956
MSLPLKRPHQHLGVDDVIPVELLNRALELTRDARAHLLAEHMAQPSFTGTHDVLVVPAALAFFRSPATGSESLNAHTLEILEQRGVWDGSPSWRGALRGFQGTLQPAWRLHGAQIFAYGTDGSMAFGGWCRRSDDDPQTFTMGVAEDLFDTRRLLSTKSILLIAYASRATG